VVMKQSSSIFDNLSQQLQQMPQLEIPTDIFSDIQHKLNHKSIVRRHRFISSMSMVAMLVLVLVYFTQQKTLDDKDLLIRELVKRTMQLEQLLVAETPRYSTPGSMITEKIVNIENYLVKLDGDIEKTRDKQLKSQLMATKLDLLGDLVLLQRKINQKPNYQKVKPYII